MRLPKWLQRLPPWPRPLPGQVSFAVVTADPPSWRRTARGRVTCVADATAARADYVVFHSPGTTPRRHCLHALAAAIDRHPDAAYLFGDAIGPDGVPWHKPGWSPALLLAQPYAADVFAVRRDMLAGLEPTGVPDAVAAYDLALRVTSRGGHVVHIPQILATTPPSAPLQPGHAEAASRAATALGLLATVTTHPDAPVLRVAVRPRTRASITVIVPTRDRLDLLGPCIEDVVSRRGGHDVRVLIVDNGSVESATLAAFARWRETGLVDVLRDERPFDYAALMNAAVVAATTPLVLLLNNDTRVRNTDWLDQLAGWLELPDVAAVGAKLYQGDGTIQHAGVVLGIGGIAAHGHRGFAANHPGYHGLLHSVRDVSAVTAACLLTRRDAWLAVGGMKPALGIAYNDVDYCLELRSRGSRVLWTPLAELDHLEGASRGHDQSGDDRLEREARFLRGRWGATLSADPFYNPNLSLSHVDYRPR